MSDLPDFQAMKDWADNPPIETESVWQPHPLRPDVTPVTPPPIRLAPALLSVVLSIPWFIGLWQILRWIFS